MSLIIFPDSNIIINKLLKTIKLYGTRLIENRFLQLKYLVATAERRANFFHLRLPR